jgi:hypothetical protein
LHVGATYRKRIFVLPGYFDSLHTPSIIVFIIYISYLLERTTSHLKATLSRYLWKDKKLNVSYPSNKIE